MSIDKKKKNEKKNNNQKIKEKKRNINIDLAILSSHDIVLFLLSGDFYMFREIQKKYMKK